jgi:hypothetical protein
MKRPAFTFDVDKALELTGKGAHAILVLFVVTQVTLAVFSGGAPMQSWRGWLALTLVIAAAVLVVTPGPYPMRVSWVAVVLAAVTVSTVLMNWSLSTTGWPGYSSWHFGANTFVLLAVALRGRTPWAWAGMGIMIAATVVWTVSTGQGVMPAVDLLDRQAGTLLVGNLFALGLSRTMRGLQQVTEAQTARTVADEAIRAAAELRDRRLAALDRTATPALRAIAAGTLSPQERAELLITEGMLRDSIRGGVLAQEPAVSRIREARRRGVDVVLLDDSGERELPPHAAAEVAAWVADQVDHVATGSFTARISVAASELVASVVSEERGQQERRFVVGAQRHTAPEFASELTGPG